MKKWQESRNYRQIRNQNGEIIANIITVDGTDVEVPEDVYQAYAQADRRERYLLEEQSAGKSRLRLKQDLQTMGVPEEIIRLVLEEEEVDEEASLRKLAQKKVASVRPQTPADWQKISRYLAGKGYGFSTIRHVIGQLQDEVEDEFWPEQ